MNRGQPHSSPTPFRSPDLVLNQATEEELLEYLDWLLVAQRGQHKELMALVELVVEDQLALKDEMDQAMTAAWLADNAPSRTSWIAVGAAGLAGYLLGRSRN